jgi:uncharacterized protein Veg
MNNNLKFGYSFLGYHTLIKLNVKFTKEQAGKLNEQYPTLLICMNKRDDESSFRIEGCLKYPESIEFKYNLQLALIDYKIKSLLTVRDSITDTISL